MNRSPSTSGAQRTSTQVNTTQVNTTHVLPHQVRAIGAAAFLKLAEEKRFLAKKKRVIPCLSASSGIPRSSGVSMRSLLLWSSLSPPPSHPSPPVGRGQKLIKGTLCDKVKEACGKHPQYINYTTLLNHFQIIYWMMVYGHRKFPS